MRLFCGSEEQPAAQPERLDVPIAKHTILKHFAEERTKVRVSVGAKHLDRPSDCRASWTRAVTTVGVVVTVTDPEDRVPEFVRQRAAEEPDGIGLAVVVPSARWVGVHQHVPTWLVQTEVTQTTRSCSTVRR